MNTSNFRASENLKTAFTLVELILVIAILSLLITLVVPVLGEAMERAQSTKCAGNLRQIGISVNLAAIDNDNRFPTIESDPTSPVYPPEEGAKSLADALSPYGVTDDVLKCPADLKGQNFFALKGSSYEWRPMIDGELTSNPILYSRFGTFPVSPSRVRIVIDFDRVHSGRMNRLYADGHVSAF